MNTKKVAHDSPHCTLIICPHNYNSPFYFFYTIASFVPKGYSGFQDTWMIECGQKSKPPKFPASKIIPPPPPKKRILYRTTHNQDS